MVRFVQKSSQRRVQSPLPQELRPQETGSAYQQHQHLLANRWDRFISDILFYSVLIHRRLNSRDLERMTGGEVVEDDCDDYVNDKFETESDKSPSETGTYTVDKDEKPPSPPTLQVVYQDEIAIYLELLELAV